MVEQWDVITIGNLSRNRFWGESDEVAVRGAICTCTLISGPEWNLLVDPSLSDEAAMAKELDRRTGLKPADVDAVFVTHAHGDHHFGLAHFGGAQWFAGAEVAEQLNMTGHYAHRVDPAPEELFDEVLVLHTPGHTLDHHSLFVECDGMGVVVAGDAVMRRDFFVHRSGYFNSMDFDLAARTIDMLGNMADIIVPGHDNYFLTGRQATAKHDDTTITT
jgi:glyoxylase-like metal-dependent hydrolase (beta-lactamase superfamily II)